MTQLDTLKQMDADLHAAFADAGLCDVGDYTPIVDGVAGGVLAGVRVYVERDVQQIGEFGQIIAPRTQIAYLLADVTPTKGGRIVVDGQAWINTDNVGDDGSLSRWIVRRG